jgi:ABC-type multidrug transport system permease subunit
VPKIKGDINPATWMLESSTPGMEERLHVSFADVYDQSEVFGETKKVIDAASKPKEGSEPLYFDSVYPRNFMQQAKICFDKFWITYWRTPEYNATRFSFSVGVALLFGTVFWKLGGKLNSQQEIFNVLGCLYTACLFLGILNAVFVQPVLSDERAVMYREKGAGMYAIVPWYCGLAAVELIYLFLQGVLYTCVVYFCCGFQKDAGKFFWFILFNLLALIYWTFYGIAAVAITPNLIAAAVISGAFYGLANLFAGFVIQAKSIPGWWIWLYWGNPVQWTLRGLITSQLGNLRTPTVQPEIPGQPVLSPSEFIFQNFGYKQGWLGYDVLVLVAFCVVFLFGAGFALKKLNFQNR